MIPTLVKNGKFLCRGERLNSALNRADSWRFGEQGEGVSGRKIPKRRLGGFLLKWLTGVLAEDRPRTYT